MKRVMVWFAVLALLAWPAAAQMKRRRCSSSSGVRTPTSCVTTPGSPPTATWIPGEPVIAYWVRLAENGRREELSWIEKKKAYGFTIKPDPSVSGYIVTLVAVPGQKITVKKEKDVVRAEAVIDGRPVVLEKMYINASGGLAGPKVHYIEVYGRDLQSGEQRREKMVPK